MAASVRDQRDVFLPLKLGCFKLRWSASAQQRWAASSQSEDRRPSQAVTEASGVSCSFRLAGGGGEGAQAESAPLHAFADVGAADAAAGHCEEDAEAEVEAGEAAGDGRHGHPIAAPARHAEPVALPSRLHSQVMSPKTPSFSSAHTFRFLLVPTRRWPAAALRGAPSVTAQTPASALNVYRLSALTVSARESGQQFPHAEVPGLPKDRQVESRCEGSASRRWACADTFWYCCLLMDNAYRCMCNCKM